MFAELDERFYVLFLALEHSLHCAVIAVSNPATYAVCFRLPFCFLPEEYALDITAYDYVGSGSHFFSP